MMHDDFFTTLDPLAFYAFPKSTPMQQAALWELLRKVLWVSLGASRGAPLGASLAVGQVASSQEGEAEGAALLVSQRDGCTYS